MRQNRKIRLPSCRRGCELRGWGIEQLAVATGLHYKTAARAFYGEEVYLNTQRAVAAAFDANPPTPGMRELMSEVG